MYKHCFKKAESFSNTPALSGSVLESMLTGTAPTGQLYSALGAGGLGALLGAGIGGLTAEKGNRLRNALMGAGLGGVAGGAGGYFLSPHLKPLNFAYVDTDSAGVLDNAKRYWGVDSAKPLVKNRPVSIAEIAGLIGNINMLGELTKQDS